MTLSHIQADLLAKKALLESEIAEKQKELERLTQQIKQPPKTIHDVVERVKPSFFNYNRGMPINPSATGRCCTHSEPAAQQLQALTDLQNWCKALNEHFGSDGQGYYCAIDDDGYFFSARADIHDESRLFAITPLYRKAAAEYAITCPDFCEALKILYTPID